MLFFTTWVVSSVILREVIVEEVYSNPQAKHIADIEVAHYSGCKRNHKELVFAEFYKLLDTVGYKGQTDERIYPHNVVLINNGISTERIHSGKGNCYKLVVVL